jgi:hypothetical protein
MSAAGTAHFPGPDARAPRPERKFIPRKSNPGPRPRSLGTHRLSRTERRELAADTKELAEAGILDQRPRTFRECLAMTQPCGWVACRHHLALEVNPRTRTVKMNFPNQDVTDLAATCSLKVAAGVPEGQTMSLQAAGRFLNISMEMARLIERSALTKLRTRIEPSFHLPPRI